MLRRAPALPGAADRTLRAPRASQPRRRFEHVGVAGIDGLDACVGQRGEARSAVTVLLDDDGDVARSDRAPVEGRSAVEQRGDVAGEVLADVRAQVVDRDVLNSPAPKRLPRHHPEAERVVVRRTGESAAGVVRVHLVDDDARVTELRALQDHLKPIHQSRVTAPIGSQRLLVARRFGSLQVGDDVAAPECVDRLLRVSDQDQSRAVR